MMVLQLLYGLSLQQTYYLVRDRLSWMRFCGLGPGDAVPDGNTLWEFREVLIRDLATGNFLDHQRNLMLIGGTGMAKCDW